MINIVKGRDIVINNLNSQLVDNTIKEYIELEKSLGNEVEVFTPENLQSFQQDLHKAFYSEEIDVDEFEKGLRDMSHLEKKIITNKQGHKQTVYVRHLATGEQHHFEHGHEVAFEHKGKQVVGTIKGLKHNDKTDKFGTAIIHDKDGVKYEKSLRGIEHTANNSPQTGLTAEGNPVYGEGNEATIGKKMDDKNINWKGVVKSNGNIFEANINGNKVAIYHLHYPKVPKGQTSYGIRINGEKVPYNSEQKGGNLVSVQEGGDHIAAVDKLKNKIIELTQNKEETNQPSPNHKIGDQVTVDGKTGTITKLPSSMTEQYSVDFGNGNVYGIMPNRIMKAVADNVESQQKKSFEAKIKPLTVQKAVSSLVDDYNLSNTEDEKYSVVFQNPKGELKLNDKLLNFPIIRDNPKKMSLKEINEWNKQDRHIQMDKSGYEDNTDKFTSLKQLLSGDKRNKIHRVTFYKPYPGEETKATHQEVTIHTANYDKPSAAFANNYVTLHIPLEYLTNNS